ncbi:hypothetical protein Rhopal_007092-T1 [Rhodotorula paludigena]|uniref:Uncharacterized protein n=1 Tax=Rhodotorula paludigena TaxID=86838 RepID=A0AAV5GU26_9BASI|nr:hypothetical protein Rhopal_007092-T1 [Rhodotorula paludigena]
MYQLGRNPPYYIPMLAALGLQIGAALSPSFAGVAICRLLVGFFISAVLLLLLPETFIDNILYRRARRLRRLTGSPLFKSPAEVSEHAAKGFGTIMKEALVMPFKVTFLDPSILFAACYMGFCYANFFCFFDAFPVVFGEIYPFSLEQLGLAFLCSVVAPALAVPCYVIYQLTYMYPLVKKHGMPIVERRLEPALLSSVTAALGLWIFAWTSFARLHWIGPMIGAGLFVWSNCITFQCIFYYVILAYPKYVASALAANDFIRSAAAAGLVHGATPLFHSRVGLHGGVSLLAGLATCGIAGVFTLYFKGASLRARSRFAESPAQVEKAVLEKIGESEGAVEVRLGEEQA